MKLNKMTMIAALAVGSLLMLSPALRAQDSTNTPPAGGQTVGGMRSRGMGTDAIMTQLKLDDATKAKVKPILDAQRQKMMDLRKDPDFSSLSREDKMAKVKAIHDDTAAQLKPILTDDQYAQWEKMGMRMRRPAPPAGDTNAPAATPPAAAPSQN
jgi:hypothetical protein